MKEANTVQYDGFFKNRGINLLDRVSALGCQV